jgi:hypothetical protein
MCQCRYRGASLAVGHVQAGTLASVAVVQGAIVPLAGAVAGNIYLTHSSTVTSWLNGLYCMHAVVSFGSAFCN